MGDCSHPCPTTHPPQQELLLQHGHPDSGPGRPKAKGCPSSEATSGRFWAPPTNASYLVRCMYVGGTGCPERSRLAPKRGLGLAVCWAALGAFSDKMGLTSSLAPRYLHSVAVCSIPGARPLSAGPTASGGPAALHSRASKHNTEHLLCALTSEGT